MNITAIIIIINLIIIKPAVSWQLDSRDSAGVAGWMIKSKTPFLENLICVENRKEIQCVSSLLGWNFLRCVARAWPAGGGVVSETPLEAGSGPFHQLPGFGSASQGG